MDKDIKLGLGKLFAEVYRLQQHMGCPIPIDAGTLYGLSNGVETAIDEVLERQGFVSNQQVMTVCRLLDDYDTGRKTGFEGYYTIEPELARAGIGRGAVATVLTMLKAQRKFTDLIEKIETGHTPLELHHLDIDEGGPPAPNRKAAKRVAKSARRK